MGVYDTQYPALYFFSLNSLSLSSFPLINNILILCVCLVFCYVEQVSANYSFCVKFGPMS